MRFSRDGRRLVHWQADALQVRDAATLQPLGTLLRPFAQAPAGALLAIDDAWVADDGHTVTVSIDAMEEPEAHRLVEMDAASGRVLRERRLEPGFRSRLLDAAGSPGLLLHAQYSGGVYWSDAGHDLRLPFPAATVPPVHAASGDGRWLAVAAGGEVLVGDRASGEWAAVLPAPPLPLGDHVVQLAFARDGGALLARTAQGRWVWWPLPDAAEDDDADLAATPTDDGPAGIAAPLPAAERARLRAADPGPPPVAAATATPTAAAVPPPPAAAGLVPLDLGPAHTRPLEPVRLPAAGFAAVPAGRQRLLGVDFDIGGVVFLSMDQAPAAATGIPASSVLLPPPRPRFAAVHLLLTGCCRLPGHPDAPYAFLVLHYADGGQARVPLHVGRDLWLPDDEPDAATDARIAWMHRTPDGMLLGLYAPRLANPHPEREVAGIAFAASEYFASGPMIYAATLELERVPERGDAAD